MAHPPAPRQPRGCWRLLRRYGALVLAPPTTAAALGVPLLWTAVAALVAGTTLAVGGAQ